ncbi:DUF6879 family protein [Murinocardiopsis flavida]|uniref:DUF6879 family protein n=1 Tax=Murinocardiopsis flavida TaxID=645275 RepID=UPI001FE57B0E|nr:DUF6879 family protein [Murinocardiopsis flavida]
MSREVFGRYFHDFNHTAFRLETLQEYAAPDERRPFERFMSEGHLEFAPDLIEWGDEIREKASRGLLHSRVHVVTEPLSDYLRFECAAGYRHNVTAGEDIRILPVKEGDWPEGIPHLDYWLFDSHRLVRMDYNPDGSLHAPVLVDDPNEIVAANVWRDRAKHLSIPYTEYESRFDAYMRPR